MTHEYIFNNITLPTIVYLLNNKLIATIDIFNEIGKQIFLMH